MKARLIQVIEVTTLEPAEHEFTVGDGVPTKHEIKRYYDVDGKLLFEKNVSYETAVSIIKSDGQI